MPPGNIRTQAPTKVIEKATAEACIAIAKKVQQARQLAGDDTGADTARLVIRSIEEELLGAGPAKK